jgi:SAM-dependent methyltransferase
MAELTGGNEYIEGIDLSPERIEFCQTFNDAYEVEDMTNFDHEGYTYDVITAMDVFMHLRKTIDIAKTMERINVHLRPGGYFIFYDAWAKDHWKAPKDADHSGFHPKQIKFFAEAEGFKAIAAFPVFKKIFWKYHSAYLMSEWVKPWVLDFLEASLPGPPGNFFIIFKKVKV